MRLPDLETVEFTDKDIKEALQRPDSFAYFGDESEMFVTWSLGPVILTRDSQLIDKSNCAVLKKLLESKPALSDDYTIESANHWAVGWVEHISYRVIDAQGKPTAIAKLLKAWFKMLKDYCIASEDHLSELEMNAEWENTRQSVDYMLRSNDAMLEGEDLDKAASDALEWLNKANPSGLEDHDGHGYCPDDDELMECLTELGYITNSDEAV